MKSTILLYVFAVLYSFCSCRNEQTATSNSAITAGQTDTLFSEILGEKRALWVYRSADNNPYVKETYPVAYLLDGDDHFLSVSGIIRQLSETSMNMVVPRMILVGILNTDRTRDLTPTHISNDPEIPDSNFVRTSGGSDKFTSFIRQELIPYIEKNYQASPYRILIGHSYGGLFVLNTLLTHPDLFEGYISIDPSAKYDDNYLLKKAASLPSETDFKGKSVFMSVSNQGYSDNETFKANQAAIDFGGWLDEFKKNNLRASWKYYPDDNHTTVPLISGYEGLRFLFDFYNPRLPYSLFREPSSKPDTFLVGHFDRVSRQIGYKVSPPERLVNWLGYLFIMEKQPEKTEKLFRMNISNYPGSPDVYDSMGEILLIKGDTSGAVANYKKSLEINPGNSNAVRVLERIGR